MTIRNKITSGFVIQEYEDLACVRQEFIEGDEADWEEEDSTVIEGGFGGTYQSFNMAQPGDVVLNPEAMQGLIEIMGEYSPTCAGILIDLKAKAV